MSKRSFALVLLFVLGCGGSLLAGFALAGGFDAGFLDESLYYEDNGEKITFTQMEEEGGYWIVVDGKVAAPPDDPSSTVVVHESLRIMQIYKITPVSIWELGNGFRPCRPDFQDCPLPVKPLPPPPPPVMKEYAFTGNWN